MAAAGSLWMLMMMLFLSAAWLSSAQAAGRQFSDPKYGIASLGPTASNGLDGGIKAASDGKQVKQENIKEKVAEKMHSVSTDDHFSDKANHYGHDGLLAFSIDYSSARHHPPKNN